MARQLFFRLASAIVSMILLAIGVYAGLNAYLFIAGYDPNAIAVAAWSAFGSLFFVLAIFITIAQGFRTMNEHLDHISANSDEQVKLLRYQLKLNQQLNKQQLLLQKLQGEDEFSNM